MAPRIYVNGVSYYDKNKRKWVTCGQNTISPKELLKPGINTLQFSIGTLGSFEDFHHAISIAPKLLSKHLPFYQSALTLLMFASILSIVWIFLSQKGWDKIACWIFVGACVLYLQCLWKIPTFAYSQDIERHIEYLRFISFHFFSPYDNQGWEHWHPATYYWLCVIFAKITAFLGFSPWEGIRFLSLLFYAVFLYFGMKSFSLLLEKKAFYLASLLLASWPAGMINSVRINNDVLCYPFYAMGFYYTLLWFKTEKPRALAGAMIGCGLAFTVKTSALVPAGILGMCGLYKLFRRQCTLKDIMHHETLWGWSILLAGILINQGRVLYDFALIHTLTLNSLGPKGGSTLYVKDFLHINARNIIRHPFFESYASPALNSQIKMALFNNATWHSGALASCIAAIFLIMIAYMAVFLLSFILQKRWVFLPVAIGILLPLAASDLFLLLKQCNACIDFHYIYPAIIALILGFFLGVEHFKGGVLRIFYYAGYGLAFTQALFFLLLIQLELA